MPRKSNLADLIFNDDLQLKPISAEKYKDDTAVIEEAKETSKKEPLAPPSNEDIEKLEKKLEREKKFEIDYNEYEELKRKLEEMTGSISQFQKKQEEYDSVIENIKKTKAYSGVAHEYGSIGRRRSIWYG